MSEVTITDDQFHQLLLLQGIDYHPNSFEFAFMKQGYELIRRAAVPQSGKHKWETVPPAGIDDILQCSRCNKRVFHAMEDPIPSEDGCSALSAPSQPVSAAPVAWYKRFDRAPHDSVVPYATFLPEDAEATGWQPLYLHPESSQPSAAKFNNCDKWAVKALRFLAEHKRPTGGEEHFNSLHLHQIADELEKCAQPSAADKPVAASEIERLQSELFAAKEGLAKERVNQTSFNECAAELAEARAQLAAIKGKAPEPQKAD